MENGKQKPGIEWDENPPDLSPGTPQPRPCTHLADAPRVGFGDLVSELFAARIQGDHINGQAAKANLNLMASFCKPCLEHQLRQVVL